MKEPEIQHDESLAEPPEEGGQVDFPCENCGADARWDPEADALSCDHCGTTTPVPRGEGTIVEHTFAEAGEAARGLGLEVRIAQCGGCGARVSFDESATSKQCVYCGSANVLEQEANRNALRPESLVPLDVGRATVEKNFRRWIGRLWFRPNDLKRMKRFNAVGVYVPFWTYDCRVHSDWSADAGHYYWVTETYVIFVKGKPVVQTRQVRKVRWVPAWGDRDDVFDDVLIHASGSQPRQLVRKLGEFDTSELVPYRPEYLAGWLAEEYQLDLEGGWDQAEKYVVETQKERCAGDVPGDTYRSLRVKNRISAVRWKHVLLPIWSLQYRYDGETYTVLVHGQTGKVVGRAPYSWVKITLAVLGALALVGLVILAVAIGGALNA